MKNFTLKQLEAFYWSAEEGSFTNASRILNTTQSAIAKRVNELEGYIGSPLFERNKSRLKLTSQGMQLFEMARNMLDMRKHIVQQMVTNDSLKGSVHLGVTELVALTWLARLITRMGLDYPGITVIPEIDGGITLYERLENKQLDLAILPGPFWSYHYDSILLHGVVNVWMASPTLGLSSKAILTPQDFEKFAVISQPKNSALSLLYNRWFEEQNIKIKTVLSCNSLNTMAQLAVSGLGIAHLPQSYFEPLVRSGKLQQLAVTPRLPQMDYYLVYRKGVINPLIEKTIETAIHECDFNVSLMTT